MTHLYELADQYRFLTLTAEDEEVDADKLQTSLAEVKDQLGNKVENIGKFCLSLKATLEAIKAEETRLASRRQVIENRIDWLRNYLLQEMTVAGIDKVQRDVLTVSIRVNPPSVNVIREDDIPQEYRVVIPETWHPDKKLIIEHFKNTGEIIPGVSIIADKKSVQIR